MDSLFFQQTKKQPCERKLNFTRSWSRRQLPLSSGFVPASLGFRAFLRALRTLVNATSETLDVNTRLYCGLVMLLVVAPLTNVLYLGFDRTSFTEGWYYLNGFYFLVSLGPHFFILASLVGMFLLFPVNSKRALALIIPFGYTVGKILWLCTVTSNEEFNRLVPSSFILLGFLLSVVLIFMQKFLMDRKYHKVDGITATILGLLKSKGIDEETRDRLVEQKFNELKSFQSKY